MSTISQLKIENIIYDIKDANAARVSHSHSASDITSGTLSISRGGTNVTSNPSMLANLDSTSADNVFKASPRPGITGTLGIANGGTGATTAANAVTNIVNGQAIAPASISASGEINGITNGTTHTLSNKINYLAITSTQEDGDETSFEYRPGDFFVHKGILRKITSNTSVPNGMSISNSWAPQVYLTEEIKKADTITSGTFSIDRIPSLAADKITSGTFSTDRIPTLPANKISAGTIGGNIAITGTLTTQGYGLYAKSTNIDRDATNPSSQTEGNSRIILTDADSERVGQLTPRRNTDGSITLSISSVNEKTDGTQVYCTIGLTVDKDGSSRYSLSDPAAFRSAISAAKNTWTQKASLYGNINGILSYDLTGCSEVMFAAYNGNIYCGSVILPIDLLSTSTQREIYLGGGYAGQGSGGRDFAIKATLTQGIIASASVDGSSITAMWVVYGR